MNIPQIYLLTLVVFFCSFAIETAFAETETFTVAAREYERKYISLAEGDEIEYSIIVSGGSNDDIEFTIYYPDGNNDGGGTIYDRFDDGFTAQTTGTYVFEFDSPSLLTNKNVRFSYEITKNTYYVYVDELPSYAKNYAGNAVYDATEFWKENLPKKQFYIAETENDSNIMISWVRDFGGFNEHVGYSYMELIEVGLGDSNCYGTWKEYDSNFLTAIMRHEIGHAIGFDHSDNPDAVMYPTINPNLKVYDSPCVSPQSLERTTETINPITQTSSKSGGGCLIATATYGSETASQVQFLREIRDNTVMNTASGMAFMTGFNQIYYTFSPTIADWERQNPIFKETVNVIITPLLATLSILNYVDITTEEEMLGYGIGIISLNVGIYFLIPIFGIMIVHKWGK